jgi:predicted TIM-barrel fold metal-dependent hydrolase
MIIDIHVHVSAFLPGHGSMSPRLLNSFPFRFMRWRLGMVGNDGETERMVETQLVDNLRSAPELDAVVALAFDAVYDDDGRLDEANTHLHVTNEYVMSMAKRNVGVLFGCSVHPHRKDAVAELERCAAGGAVLMKWLPITQGFSPADPRCFPLYEALAHYGIPLLSHTGWERTLPTVNASVADPTLLAPALERGVTVIAAHCGTRSAPGESCHVSQFMRMAHEYEHFYGDTAALNLPTRCYAYPRLLGDPVVRDKLVHGSDWPVVPIPHPMQVGWRNTLTLLGERNWLSRDIQIKEQLGFDDAYWRRAATLLGLPLRGARLTRPATRANAVA